MIRKLSILVIFIGFFGTKSFCSNSSFITPINLSEDTTSINLSYLFNSQIDSVICEIAYTLTHKNQILERAEAIKYCLKFISFNTTLKSLIKILYKKVRLNLYSGI